MLLIAAWIGNQQDSFSEIPILITFKTTERQHEKVFYDHAIAACFLGSADRSAWYHVEQLRVELAGLQERKGFVCRGVEPVCVTYAGDVGTQIEIFHKLLPFVEDGDILYGCLTYGNKPMPIAELMAIQYGYRALRNVSIGCLVYGELDHSREEAPMTLFDITALIRLDEIVRVLADRKVRDPGAILERLLS